MIVECFSDWPQHSREISPKEKKYLSILFPGDFRTGNLDGVLSSSSSSIRMMFPVKEQNFYLSWHYDGKS